MKDTKHATALKETHEDQFLPTLALARYNGPLTYTRSRRRRTKDPYSTGCKGGSSVGQGPGAMDPLFMDEKEEQEKE